MTDSTNEPTRLHSEPLESDPGSPGGPPKLTTGEVLAGRYLVIDEIGRGGFATVYRVKDLQLERDVALKVLHTGSQRPGDSEGFAALLEEARSLAELDHPQIVPVHDAGEYEGHAYLTMPLVEGASLEDLLERKGRLEWGEFLHLFQQICEALDHAHDRGVIHADLKPSNILLQGSDQAKVVDFGIARRRKKGESSGDGTISGTIGYLAPEILRGTPANRRSDVFSLGCLAYRMLSGQVPFIAPRIPQYLGKIHSGPDLSKLPRSVPKKAPAVLAAAMSAVPGERPASAGRLFSELAATQRKGGLGRKIAVAGLFLAAVASGLFFAQKSQPLRAEATLMGAAKLSDNEISAPGPLVESSTLYNGDYYFLSDVQVNRDAYIQLLHLDSSGRVNRLYPGGDEAENPGDLLQRGFGYSLPPDPLPWWQLGDEPGIETVYLVVSEEPSPLPKAELTKLAEPLRSTLQNPEDASEVLSASLSSTREGFTLRSETEQNIEDALGERYAVVHKYSLLHRSPPEPPQRANGAQPSLPPPPVQMQGNLPRPLPPPPRQPQGSAQDPRAGQGWTPPPPPQGGAHPWPPPPRPGQNGAGGHPPPGGQPPPPPREDDSRRR